MDSLLKHMIHMTGHRDHTMLDLSVISGVQELAGATHTRMLSVVTVYTQQYIRERATIGIGAGAVTRADEHADLPSAAEPIEAYPELQACLAQHNTLVERVARDGQRIMWLPIWIGDRADACLEIVHTAPFSSETMLLIDGIVSVYRNFHNLINYSERDSLTGLLNRKTFDDRLAKMLRDSAAQDAAPPSDEERRQNRQEEKQWLAVIDIDHFKLVNDKFGHLYGDEVLILIANLLLSSFRANDRVFRFGGEEFIVLLRSTSLDDVEKILERFRISVASHPFPQVGRVTVSVGFVSINAHDAPVVILGHADQALYYAKSHGRNQTCYYDELVSGGRLPMQTSNDSAEFF
jgi:diguanylate cyclase (GGDEF)-like protein